MQINQVLALDNECSRSQTAIFESNFLPDKHRAEFFWSAQYALAVDNRG
jgi:hypothetical protein